MSDQDQVKLSFNRVVVRPENPPKPVHKVFWSRVGNDILLDVGYIALVETRAAITKAKEGEEPEPLSFYVTDRFSLTPQAAVELKVAIEQMREQVQNIE